MSKKYQLATVMAISSILNFAHLMPAKAETENSLRERLNELRRQDEIRREGQWINIGRMQVDWNSWKKHPDGVRTVWARPLAANESVQSIQPIWQAHMPITAIGLPTKLAIDCNSLKMSIKRGAGTWSKWKLPEKGSTGEEIILKICSEVSTN